MKEIWEIGEDGRLREDSRFVPTPWGRWILMDHCLANDWLYERFQKEKGESFVSDFNLTTKDTENPQRTRRKG